jgi:hypothetical protein
MRRHVDLLVEWLTADVAVRDFRKHVGWYLAGYPVGGLARRAASTAETIPELHTALERMADEHGDVLPVPGAEALPRGKVSGPRKVVLPDGWLDSLDDPTPPEGAELLTSGG